jgi:drug/metabolite transporter (DMT)-like permease
MARLLVRDDPPRIAFFYVGAVGALVLTPLVPFVWVTPTSGTAFLLMFVMGAAGAIGHYALIVAHKYAPASILAPFIYTQLVWMVLLGWTVFGDVPDHPTLWGAAVVIASGLYLLWRERIVQGQPKSLPDPDAPL